ncbi:hypothetical protein N0V90_012967 [Kalmusia sp. IMI 367209]|nr:hypothetical protein N0V90_012967 [Kalmusia sp. IMI 367209]
MGASPIVNFALRGFQIVFASVVLGLSVGLIRGQAKGLNSPISLRYASFVGGVSLITAFVGIAAEWISVLQGMIGLAIDGVVTLINIAGGVLLAIQIGNSKCGDTSYDNRQKLLDNHLFSGGCGKGANGQRLCYNELEGREGKVNERCKECQADTVFMFFIVAILLASSVMTFLRTRKGY